MTAPVRRCAVLGSPIQHSLSPALHEAAYAELGLTDWRYERYEVTEEELPGFVAGCDSSWRGLSLTMPLKLVAMQLGEPDEVASLVGAANTLVFDANTRRVHNTDVGGLVAAVQRALATEPDRVTILGSGATARSALVSAARLGASRVTVVARDPGKGERLRSLAEACGVGFSVASWDDGLEATDLVVSAVTAGAADARSVEISDCAPVIFDAIYDPWPTPLAEAAERAGRAVLNGLDLLTEQAVLQIELMTGHRVDSALLLRVARSALAARPQGGRAAGAVAPR